MTRHARARAVAAGSLPEAVDGALIGDADAGRHPAARAPHSQGRVAG
jgi:hypothetical protein